MTMTEYPILTRQGAVPGGPQRRWSLRRVAALSTLGLAAVTLAACSSSSSASTTSAAPSANSGNGGSGGTTGAAAPRRFPGASGTIAAINGAALEVQNPTSGQTTVTYSPTTTFEQTVTTTSASVTVGSCISAFGKPTSTSSSTSAFGRPITATSVSITQPTSGSCTAGFGGGFGGAGSGTGRPPGAGGFPGGAGGGERPNGGTGSRRRFSGQFGAASGSVTAVNGTTLTVSETNPATKKASTVVVTLTAGTTFAERQTAAATDLAVGKCASAVGAADSTGAVTARTITISAPGPDGCTAGFGGFRGGPGTAGGAGPGPGSVAGA